MEQEAEMEEMEEALQMEMETVRNYLILIN